MLLYCSIKVKLLEEKGLSFPFTIVFYFIYKFLFCTTIPTYTVVNCYYNNILLLLLLLFIYIVYNH